MGGMSLHRRLRKGPMSSMMIQRKGGRVNLFNYNPSIAGGRIGVQRYKTSHRRGQYLRHKEHEALVSAPSGGGLTNPGHVVHGHGAGPGNYMGIGATGRTAMHPINAKRKQIQEVIAQKLHANKKART